jgi:hypothetical protein
MQFRATGRGKNRGVSQRAAAGAGALAAPFAAGAPPAAGAVAAAGAPAAAGCPAGDAAAVVLEVAVAGCACAVVPLVDAAGVPCAAVVLAAASVPDAAAGAGCAADCVEFVVAAPFVFAVVDPVDSLPLDEAVTVLSPTAGPPLSCPPPQPTDATSSDEARHNAIFFMNDSCGRMGRYIRLARLALSRRRSSPSVAARRSAQRMPALRKRAASVLDRDSVAEHRHGGVASRTTRWGRNDARDPFRSTRAAR